MKKKNWKIRKKVLVVLFIIFFACLIIFARKIILISRLESKLGEYEQKDNIYVKVSSNDSNFATYEKYYKNGVQKDVIYLKEKEAKVVQFTYPEQRKVFLEGPDYKILNIYEEYGENGSSPILTSYTDSVTISELLINSITSNIKTEVIEGKLYYVLSGLHNSNVLYHPNTTNLKIYIEKETGLTKKVIETIQINQGSYEKITTYEYGFGTVTTEDMQEPNQAEYVLEKQSGLF